MMTRQYGATFLVMALLGLSFLLLGGQEITLIAKDYIIIVPTLEEAISREPKTILVTMIPGEHAEVASCKDVKHYIIPKVQLRNVEGYVYSGTFILKRERVLFSLKKVFSC